VSYFKNFFGHWDTPHFLVNSEEKALFDMSNLTTSVATSVAPSTYEKGGSKKEIARAYFNSLLPVSPRDAIFLVISKVCDIFVVCYCLDERLDQLSFNTVSHTSFAISCKTIEAHLIYRNFKHIILFLGFVTFLQQNKPVVLVSLII
jgi:hypothetical protein